MTLKSTHKKTSFKSYVNCISHKIQLLFGNFYPKGNKVKKIVTTEWSTLEWNELLTCGKTQNV